MKINRVMEVMNVISAGEAIAEWEAIRKKYRDQETDPVFLYKMTEDRGQRTEDRGLRVFQSSQARSDLISEF